MTLWSRLRALSDCVLHGSRWESRLDAELRSYFDMLVDRYCAQGMPEAQARRAARLEFGGTEQVKEMVREVRVGTRIGTWVQDARYGCRALAKAPAFTAVAVLTLALGLAINTAIFSVVYGALLRPLPYGNPDRLVLIWSTFQKTGISRAPASGPALAEIRRRNRVFQDVAAIWVGTGTFTGGSEAEQVKLASVTTNYLSMLGVRPALGRVFLPEEEPGGRIALVLTDGLWRRRFAADPHIVGKSVSFQGQNATVIGVLPADFQLRYAPDANVPVEVQAFAPFPMNVYKMPLTVYYLRLAARLRPGVTMAQAQQDLDQVAAQMRGAYGEFNQENMTLQAVPMHADAVREIRPALVALLAGAVFVMLICCVNLANLVLARANDRRREVALRSALGASSGRLVQQLLIEGGLLCALAGAVGLGLGWAGIRWLAHVQPLGPGAGELAMSWPVAAFAAGLCVAAVLLCSLAPACGSARQDLISGLRGASGKGGASAAATRVRAALIVCEVTLGFVLVIGAGLMIRTFVKIQHVRPGFDSAQLLTFEIQPSGRRYAAPGALFNFVHEWEAQVSAMPGVEHVGSVSHLPLDDYPNWYSSYRPEGADRNQGAAMLADYRSVTPGFLQAMGTRLLEGRYFDSHDRADAPQVVIVDEIVARTAWPGESALGKKIEGEHITAGGFGPVWAQVVGVVEHVRNHSLSRDLRGELYIPFEQSPRAHLSYAIRSHGDPLALAAGIRQALHRMDPNMAISKMRPMTAYVERAQAPAVLTAVVAGIFGALALLLAAVGIYGVICYSISRRMQEMGVRMALGAARTDVMALVMREGLALTGLGMLLGGAGAFLVTRQLHALLYGVSATDPLTYAIALLAIPAAAIVGCWKPAWKAASANPMDAMRSE